MIRLFWGLFFFVEVEVEVVGGDWVCVCVCSCFNGRVISWKSLLV